jgi:FkbM family methyltransferase
MQGVGYIKPYKVNYETLWGDKMSFYLPEGGAIYYYGFFEANLSNFFINILKEGDVFIDVGAHVGYYTMLTSALVGKTGKVYSFEPTPRTFQSLKVNASSKPNIIVNNLAVLKGKEQIQFYDYGPKYSAFNSFKPRTSKDIYFKDTATKVLIQTTSLDAYCDTHNVSPTIIKIDAEGAEHVILGSMQNVLSEKKPLISIEVAGDEEWKENCTKSIHILLDHGYEPYEITLKGYLQKHIVKEVYSYDNLLFVHPSKEALVTDFILN